MIMVLAAVVSTYPPAVRTGELISVAFYVALVVVSTFTPLPSERRIRIAGSGLAGVLFAWSLRFVDGTPGGHVMRDLMPALLLLIGYWQSGQFFNGPDPRVQAAFRSIELRWFPSVQRLSSDLVRRPRLAAYLEASYLWCYALIPLGVTVLHTTGHAAMVDRFWMVLLVPTFVCHGCTVFAPSLPPWRADSGLASDRESSRIRSLSTWLLEHASITANTFPSGHVASSFGAALVISAVTPIAGAAFLWMAASIAVATTVLRYHYTLDAVLGAALALLAFVLFG
jgi:hypothetical protein